MTCGTSRRLGFFLHLVGLTLMMVLASGCNLADDTERSSTSSDAPEVVGVHMLFPRQIAPDNVDRVELEIRGRPDEPDFIPLRLSQPFDPSSGDALPIFHIDVPIGEARHFQLAAFAQNDSQQPIFQGCTLADIPAMGTTVVVPLFAVDAVNQRPVLRPFGEPRHLEGEAVSLQLLASDPDCGTLRYQAMNLPPDLRIDQETGLISGKVAVTAAVNSPYLADVEVTDGSDHTEVSFAWIVVNRLVVAEDDRVTTNEDTVVDIAVLRNDVGDDGALLTVTSTTPGMHGTLVLTGNETVQYTPSADFNGVDGFAYTVSNSLGDEDTAAVTVAVNAVNDAPHFVPGPNQNVLANAGTQTVANWATAISAGPPDEVNQTLSFLVSADTPGLFTGTGQPAITATGTLTYAPAPGADGQATVTVELHDDGGTANGGVDTSLAQTFTITISGPSVLAQDDTGTVLEDTAVTMNLLVNDMSDTNAALTVVGITQGEHGTTTVNVDGTVRYIPNPDFNGADRFMYTVSANDGETDAATVTVTVTAVNDRPTYVRGDNVMIFSNAGPQTIQPWATAISPGPPDETDQTLAFQIIENSNPALFAALPAITDDGTLSFTPAQDASGTALLTVQLQDDGGTHHGGVDTSALEVFHLAVIAEEYTVTSTDDAPDVVPGDGVCATTVGSCTLRAALQEANETTSTQRIGFNIPGAGPHTIQPSAMQPAWPRIVQPVVIDGYTQPGARPNTLADGNNAILLIELDGGGNEGGLTISNGRSLVRGLVINRFADSGILLEVEGGSVIEGNFIGTDVSGAVPLGNNFGIIVGQFSQNLIGGTTVAARNLISGNTLDGILIFRDATANLVQGNFIGTDITGTSPLGNGVGVGIRDDASDNTVGGTTAAARNLISGNGGGMSIGNNATANLVQGNFIGTDVTGTRRLANSGRGISINASSNNTVGGTIPGARNIISGNGSSGVFFSAVTATANIVQGNYIGTDVTGTMPLGNDQHGIEFENNASTNIIGGTFSAARNIIADNQLHGIRIAQGATANMIQGNFIGTDVSGVLPLGNGRNGVTIGGNAVDNVIGGTVDEAGNVIASNNAHGLELSSLETRRNAIVGNAIVANGDIGIDLLPEGVTLNDTGDLDTGPNTLQNFPELTLVSVEHDAR
jgi:CSLREA domain-containing protein